MDSLVVVGIGGWRVSKNPGDVLRTYGLGSCVALVLQHPSTRTVGLVHILLPDSLNQPGGPRKGPGHYADSAVPLLIREVATAAGIFQAGGSGMVAKLAGGASMWCRDSLFQVGERNVEVVKRQLQQHHIPLIASDIGGTVSRTVTVGVASGEVVVTHSPGYKELRL